MTIRQAIASDLERLLPLVADFHAHEKLPTTPESRRRALQGLLDDPARGSVVLAEEDGRILGYGVFVLGYSIEFGGVDSFADELYVASARRSKGVGTELLGAMEAAAKKAGASCLHLEVDLDNQRALELYGRLDYRLHKRRLMTKQL